MKNLYVVYDASLHFISYVAQCTVIWSLSGLRSRTICTIIISTIQQFQKVTPKKSSGNSPTLHTAAAAAVSLIPLNMSAIMPILDNYTLIPTKIV